MLEDTACRRCGNPRVVENLSVDPVPRLQVVCRCCGTVEVTLLIGSEARP